MVVGFNLREESARQAFRQGPRTTYQAAFLANSGPEV
jgi:hypothetical protein